ncbi:glycerate kinase type-2 family protein [Leptospira sanjuanensis]|uniref:glycerate kinase type-2 family protein n=1 Tax=Leptospira sanjuanensis TaxID=2879643 RepID=UPI001EE7B90D|nr:DUF4147 domain-containing protein [Leptospira sanjuanensis]MCG6168277.1 DUF4147 domain-containing protein [Leptospira sanjuanensis]
MPALSWNETSNLDLNSPRSVLFHLGRIAIRSSLPGPAVRRFLESNRPSGRIVLFSIGKAAEPMAAAAYELLESQISGGLILTKYGHLSGNQFPKLEILEAGHPVPDANSIAGGKRILELCASLQPEDTALVLLSGGGSALLEVPAAGLSLEDLIVWNERLLESGADIREINSIRILLSEIKGGGLLSKILPAKSITLILSDVLGDDLSKVASGPTIPSKIDPNSIFRIFEHYHLPSDSKIKSLLEKKIPQSKAISSFESDRDSPKPDPSPRDFSFSSEDSESQSKRNSVHCIGNIRLALESVQTECRKRNIPILFLTSCLDCEAKEAGFFLGSIAKEAVSNSKTPLLILCGGETTVTHDGKGKGGRNQELALAFAKQIVGESGITLFSLATDGSDGPTDAAGAIVDGTTWNGISQTNDPNSALQNHNSYEALRSAGALVFTGPTGTNVNDIQFLWITPNEKR